MRVRRLLRQNLLLALGVAALAGLVWVAVRQEQAAAPAPLTQVDTDRIGRLSVTAGDRPARRFERRDGRWWMQAPYALPAHAEAVERLLAIARATPRSRYAADRFDLARIGLQPPQAVLELGSERIAFGITDAIHADRYVLGADGVALLPDRFSAWLMAPAESEIDRRLAAPLDVVREVRVDGVARPELIAAWERVTTSQILAAPADADGSGTVAVELGDARGGQVRYTLKRSEDGRYAARRADPALLYPLEETQMQFLLPAPAAAVR